MPHRNYSMLFDDFRIIGLSFSLNKTFKGKEPVPVNTQIGIAHKYDNRRKTLTVGLRISSTEGNMPFFFKVESRGRFIFKGAPDDNLIECFSKVNCPAIMFPYVRETIADITRRAGFPPLHLAPVNFIKLAERFKAVKKT